MGNRPRPSSRTRRLGSFYFLSTKGMGIERARALGKKDGKKFFFFLFLLFVIVFSGGVGEKVFHRPHQNATPCTTTIAASWGNSLVSFRSIPTGQQVVGTDRTFLLPSFLLHNNTLSPSDRQNVQEPKKNNIKKLFIRTRFAKNDWNHFVSV